MKKLALILTWFTATFVAVGVAWAGVSVVDNQVIDPSPVLSAPILDSTSGSDDNSASTSSTSSSTSSTSTTSTSSTSTSTTVSPAVPSGPASTAAPQPSTPQSTPSSSSTSSTSTTVPNNDTAPADATTQTFTLVGGTAAFSFSSSGVQVLWATPNPGYTVKIEPEQPGFKVEFRSDAHRSRVDAWWSGGPRHEIREEPRD